MPDRHKAPGSRPGQVGSPDRARPPAQEAASGAGRPRPETPAPSLAPRPTEPGGTAPPQVTDSRPTPLPAAVGVVPARLGSTRLPEKMLADLAGQPLVVRTAQGALASGAFARVIVATDHERIAAAVRAAGLEAMLTDPAHPSGSARVAEVARRTDGQLFVNIQGDEPLVDGEGLRRLVAAFADPAVGMATLWFPLRPEDEDNPNAVKVVADAAGNALYFSRSLIPHPRARDGFRPRKHVGVYGYRREVLQRLMDLPPTDLERVESLEQLRALYHGIPIRLVEAARDSVGVDTQADLDRVRATLERSL